MPASTILVLESAARTQSLVPVLAGAGYTVNQSVDPDDAVARIVEHQLVVLDIGEGEAGQKAGVDLCREIRATPSMSSVPILCVASSDDVEERIGFLEAGADDVIARPFDAREVEARVEALLLRFQRSRDTTPIVTSNGVTLARPRRTVAVYSPKGGVGTTMIAANIAIAASRRRSDRVVLVDLDLQFGSIASQLNLTPRQTIKDVVRDDSALREPELLRTYAMRHDSGLHVLAAPVSPAEAELITPDHVAHLIGTLLEAYDAVVIDAGSVLDERIMNVFEAADTLVIPVYPELSALRAARSLLNFLEDAGTLGDKTLFVLNNVFAREILKPRDIEAALGKPISLHLPYDPFLYLKAVNEGVPVVLADARSAAATELAKLTVAAFGQGSPEHGSDGRKGGLFGFRKKG